MTIRFTLRFSTHPGQSLLISGDLKELGENESSRAFPMTWLNEQLWQASVDLGDDLTIPPASFHYKYILRETNEEEIVEWGDDRFVDIGRITAEEVDCIDTWNHAGEFQNAFYTAPFKNVLLSSPRPSSKPKPYRGNTHVFMVKAPLLKKHEVLCIIGNGKALGSWESETAVQMGKEGDWWTAGVNLSNEQFPLTYKYGVYDPKQKRFIEYEGGDNRIIYPNDTRKKFTIVRDGFAQLPNSTWRAAGVAIPVFSLRSEKGFGVGEFTDIKLLVDWAKITGLKLVQILPVNDTISTHSWCDSYPYSAISAFALHPIYLNLEKVAGKEFTGSVKSLRKKQKELNDFPALDYEAVMKLKLSVIRDLFQLQKDKVFATEAYKIFFNENRDWLVPYAAFSYLRDKYNSADYRKWKTFSVYNEQEIEKFTQSSNKHFDQIAVQYFTQFHLHLQLQEAHDYAGKNGVIVKGDIPIGISRNGVDAWMSPELYYMDQQAGAPPDDFAVKGQNWGFPTYNWKKMQEDGFAWWKRRFEQMSRYFDTFRIDHILGFFRIWSIPEHAVEGIMGHFVPSIPIYINEFHQKNIWFDQHRFCQPFINDAILWEMFGPNEKKFKPFLAESAPGQFELKEAFNTQRKIEQHFGSLELNEENDRIKHGLFDLISNVILFEEKESQGTAFHFRFNMQSTFSFRYLDIHTQEQLKDIYVNYFFRRQDEFWRKEAMKKLPALKRASDMLICGEDLGLVPACVPDLMKQLGILSLEIQRMPKDPKKEFFHPNEAPYLSVVTPSTHDMSTIRGWWEEERSKTQRFYNSELGQYSEAPYYCEAWINRSILIQHLYSPAMWSIFQLQDIMGIDEHLRRENPHEERINVPANAKHYWKYRMHMTMENLIREKQFNADLKQLVASGGRL